MIEIRVKANDVQEINDFMDIFRFPLGRYMPIRMSKAYVMRSGQYKFFCEFVSTEEYKHLRLLDNQQINNTLDQGITKPGKKRGRKPKGLKVLDNL